MVKVGTSSLTDERGQIEPPKLWAIARALQVLQASLSCKAVLVSSGAGAAGRQRLGLHLPLTLPEKQAAAAVGQALLMMDWARAFAPLPLAQLLLSAADIRDRQRYVNAKNALEASLKLGVLPIINENDSVATSEIRFGDNDTLSAWVAYLIDAEALIILTDVDGLYDADPRSQPHARRLEVIDDIASVRHLAGAAGSQRGTGGMVTKLQAADIASAAGIDTLIIGQGAQALEALAQGHIQGSHIRAHTRTPARKAWLARQQSQGSIVVDVGALRALQQGKSLLPSGVLSVAGRFAFGDAVAVVHADQSYALGLSNYPSEALQQICGLQTHAIAATLGYKDYDEVIHRDNLVLLEPASSS